MKINKIVKNKTKSRVFDITVDGADSYILENGVITHNSGIQYGCSAIIHISKSKEEDAVGGKKSLIGSGARCTAAKNRFAKEKKQVRVVIDHSKGLARYSGLFDLALEVGSIDSPSSGWYTYTKLDGTTSDKMRKKEFNSSNEDIWEEILDSGLRDALHDEFSYKAVADGVFDEFENENEKDEDERGEI